VPLVGFTIELYYISVTADTEIHVVSNLEMSLMQGSINAGHTSHHVYGTLNSKSFTICQTQPLFFFV
jgi:hypothetical protein